MRQAFLDTGAAGLQDAAMRSGIALIRVYSVWGGDVQVAQGKSRPCTP